LTSTHRARRFIDDLNNIQPTIINASGKEAELERVEIEIGSQKLKCLFILPPPKGK